MIVGRKCVMTNGMPPVMRQQFMYGGRGGNDLFLLVCRWCDKSPTPVAILRAAWPVFADPPDLALCGERDSDHPSNHFTPLYLLHKYTKLLFRSCYSLAHFTARKIRLLLLRTRAGVICMIDFLGPVSFEKFTFWGIYIK